MDDIKKTIPEELMVMERLLGRMMRNMALPRMFPLETANSFLADVYETESEVMVCVEVPGIDHEKISVVAESEKVMISGERKFPVMGISCIHQLEIEYGHFERSIPLPVPVDVANTTSVYKNGFLLIRMPKSGARETVKIKVS